MSARIYGDLERFGETLGNLKIQYFCGNRVLLIILTMTLCQAIHIDKPEAKSQSKVKPKKGRGNLASGLVTKISVQSP